MPIGNARPFEAGNGNIMSSVAAPLVNSAGKVVSAAYAARKKAQQVQQAKATVKQSQAPVQEELAPTKVMPVAGRSDGDTMRSAIRANNLRRDIAAAKSAALHPELGRTSAGAPTRPTSLDQVPHYAVGQAMRPQRQREIHRALSSLQYKNQD